MRLPQTVGDYRFLERIGGGAFGTVYRAEIEGELGYKQECAVKVLDPGRAAAEPEEVASLADEARILSRLHHPSIVHVRRFVHLTHEFMGETWGLEMELVRGVTLDALIAEQGRLSVPAVVLIISELLEGLQYAHAAKDEEGLPLGLVHRDLKPENIVVTHEGRLKLLDFGIARAEGRIGHDTAVGETKGTPLYMSPEQLRGEPLTGVSDLYAVGTLAFELLTPERYVHLERAPDVQAVLIAVSETRFEDRRWLLERCLAEKPSLTAAQAEALASWLGALLQHETEDRTARAADALDELATIPGLYRPHRARELLKGLVDEIAGGLESLPELVPVPLVSAGPTQLVSSSGARHDGDDQDWLLGDVSAVVEISPRRSFRWWVSIFLGAATIVAALLSVVFLTEEGRPSDSGETIPALAEDPPAAAPITEPSPAEPVVEDEPDVDATTFEEIPSEAASGVPVAEPTPAPKTPGWAPAPAVIAVVPPPELTLTHTPPPVAVAGSPLKLRVVVSGACAPKVVWGPSAGPLSKTKAFEFDGGGDWVTSVQVPYDTAHASGISYYVTCCTPAGTCPVSWRSPSSPHLVPAPAF